MKRTKRKGNDDSFSVLFLLYSIFERMDAALYNGSEGGILNDLLAREA